jgi:PTS system nitrogen regulatory IIA component
MDTDRSADEMPVVKQTDDPARLIEAPEVALILGVSKETVWKWTREGRIPVVRLRGRVRYRRSRILEWLEETEVGG